MDPTLLLGSKSVLVICVLEGEKKTVAVLIRAINPHPTRGNVGKFPDTCSWFSPNAESQGASNAGRAGGDEDTLFHYQSPSTVVTSLPVPLRQAHGLQALIPRLPQRPASTLWAGRYSSSSRTDKGPKPPELTCRRSQ